MTSITSSKNVSPTQYRRKEYAYITMSASQTTSLGAGDPIKFNTLSSGNVQFDGTTYTATLKANKSYRISSALGTQYSNIGIYYFQLYNVTTSSYIGIRGRCETPTYTSHVAPQSTAFVDITPTVDTQIQVRTQTPGNYISQIDNTESWWSIEEIDGYYPNTQKWDYAYVSPILDLTVTGTNWTTVKAVCQFFKANNGLWSMWLSILGTTSSASRTTYNISVTGVSFDGSYTSGNQALSGSSTNAYVVYCVTSNTTGDKIYWSHASATTQCYYCEGKVLLASKPTGYAIPSDV